MESLIQKKLSQILFLFSISLFTVNNALASMEKGVQLNCAGSSCIQIGVQKSVSSEGEVLYFYTSSSTSITVEQVMQRALTPIGTPINYTATYFHNPPGYAAMIINDVPKSTSGKFGEEYWALCVNGKAADLGMSSQMIKNGDKVLWVYSKYPPKCN